MAREGLRVASDMAKKKSKAIDELKNELRVNLLKLSEACPFHHANPEDCPLFSLRKMEPADRLLWINALSERELAYLATYHRVCLRIKMESGLTKPRTRTLVKSAKRTRGKSGRWKPV